MRFKPRTGGAVAALAALGLCATLNAGTAALYIGPGANWSDGSQWSTQPYYPDNGNPAGATYDVTINSGAQIQLDKDITVDNVTLNGGQIFGSSKLDVNNTFTFNSGDIVMSGSSTFANMVINGIVGKRMGRGTINISNSLVWNDNAVLTSFFSTPTLNILSGATFDVKGAGGVWGSFITNNAGTLNSATGAFATFESGTFNNTGTVNVHGGLKIEDAGTHSGTINVDAAASLQFDAPNLTFQPSSVINSQGTLGLIVTENSPFHGTFNATGPTTIGWMTFFPDCVIQNLGSSLTIAHPTFDTGKTVTLPTSTLPENCTLDGTDTVNINGPLAWNNGVIATPVTNLNANTTFIGGHCRGDVTLNNNATFTFSGPAALYTRGTTIINNNAGALMDFGDGRIDIDINGQVEPLVNNYGTIRGTSPVNGGAVLDGTLNNYNTVDIQTGQIAVKTLNNQGAITLAAGTKLFVSFESVSGSASSSITGAGSVAFHEATGTISGEYDVAGGTEIGGTGGVTNITFGPDAKVKNVGQLLSVDHFSSVTFNTGQAVQLNDVFLDGTLNGPDNITIHGTLYGQGTINAHVSPHDLAPGHSPGTMTLGGGLTLLSDSTTEIQLGGLAQGSGYDFVNVTGAADLAGILDISFFNGFQSSVLPGNTFTILTASDLTGDFANVADGTRINTSDGCGSFLVTYTPTGIVLSDFSTTLVPEPAMLSCAAALAGAALLRTRRNRLS